MQYATPKLSILTQFLEFLETQFSIKIQKN